MTKQFMPSATFFWGAIAFHGPDCRWHRRSSRRGQASPRPDKRRMVWGIGAPWHLRGANPSQESALARADALTVPCCQGGSVTGPVRAALPPNGSAASTPMGLGERRAYKPGTWAHSGALVRLRHVAVAAPAGAGLPAGRYVVRAAVILQRRPGLRLRSSEPAAALYPA